MIIWIFSDLNNYLDSILLYSLLFVSLFIYFLYSLFVKFDYPFFYIHIINFILINEYFYFRILKFYINSNLIILYIFLEHIHLVINWYHILNVLFHLHFYQYLSINSSIIVLMFRDLLFIMIIMLINYFIILFHLSIYLSLHLSFIIIIIIFIFNNLNNIVYNLPKINNIL